MFNLGQNVRHLSEELSSMYDKIIFNSNFIEVCSQWSNYQESSTDSDNGLEPNMRQAIISINDGSDVTLKDLIKAYYQSRNAHRVDIT